MRSTVVAAYRKSRVDETGHGTLTISDQSRLESVVEQGDALFGGSNMAAMVLRRVAFHRSGPARIGLVGDRCFRKESRMLSIMTWMLNLDLRSSCAAASEENR